MDNVEKEIKQLIINSLNLEDLTVENIKSDEPLFGEGLGLDSIDALELGMALQRKYDIKIDSAPEEVRQHFYSVRTIADFIVKRRAP